MKLSIILLIRKILKIPLLVQKKKKENTKGIKKFITKNLQADMTKT